MEFVSIDVETANSDMASICQVGIAIFNNNKVIEEWSTLINPNVSFNFRNTLVHGIDEKSVLSSPLFSDVAIEINKFLDNKIVISHSQFDRIAINKVFEKHSINCPSSSWIDTTKVVRRAWPEFSKKGYGLNNICKQIGYEFKHHDALEDAKAAGYVMLAAIQKTSISLKDWEKRILQPINISNNSRNIFRDIKSADSGKLNGHVVVFTGALSITRKEAAELVASMGCTLSNTINKRTTLLILGEQNSNKKSAKQLRAEALISDGQHIEIINETDFYELIKK